MDGWMDRSIDKGFGEALNRWLDLVAIWVDEFGEGLKTELMDGWMDGYMDLRIYSIHGSVGVLDDRRVARFGQKLDG